VAGESTPSRAPATYMAPRSSVALPLLFRFTFMLIIEQLSSPSHHHHHRVHRPGASPDSVFDVELAALEDEAEHEHGGASAPLHARRASADIGVEGDVPVSSSANAITIGLVVHSLADGLALGMSMLSGGDESPSSHSYGLSLVVFLALAVHKGTYATHQLSSFFFFFFPWPSSLTFCRPCSCSSHLAGVHRVSDVDLSLAGGV
jgi:zinc transporter 9